MTYDAPAYGRWLPVAMNSLVFIVIMPGFLLQWLTILTLAMFPLLVFVCVHLAHAEETEARQAFGDACARYAARVPGWIPGLRHSEAHHGLT